MSGGAGRVDEMFRIRHRGVTDTRVAPSYGVCRGPGGPLGAVTGFLGGGRR
jgi:hypothetical protein